MYIYCTSPGDGQTSWKVWLTSVERHRCSNEAKTRTPLKFAGVPQTRQLISAVSRLKFTILWGHAGKILLCNRFFFRLSIHALIAKIQPDKVVRWCADGDFFCNFCMLYFQHVQHISDIRSKFALRPHRVSKYDRHPICDHWELARKKKKKEETTAEKYNGLPYWVAILNVTH